MSKRRVSLGVEWFDGKHKKPIMESTKAESDLIVCLQEEYGDLPSILKAYENGSVLLNETELKIIKVYIDLGYKIINIK